jgi:hypothetical protein
MSVGPFYFAKERAFMAKKKRPPKKKKKPPKKKKKYAHTAVES